MSSPYTDRFLKVNGVKLHFQDWGGPAASIPLLMVHGITMQSHAFDPVASILRHRYRCLALDLRGHGDSEWTDPANYEYAVYADDVLALLDALGIEKVHYLGTSLGGRVAMTVATRQAQRLASLVLNDISPEPADAGIARIVDSFGGDKPPFPTVEDYVEQVVFSYVPRLRALPMELLAKNARWSLREVDGGFLPKFDPSALFRLSAPGDRARVTDMLRQGLRSVSCPVLLLRGEQSDIVSPDAVRLMQQALPRLQVVEIPGVGHPPALTEPASQQALEKFFA